MEQQHRTTILLGGQRALRGAITPNVRAVSADVVGTVVRWRAYFHAVPTEEERELLTCAATELLADFPDGFDLEEEYVVAPAPSPMVHWPGVLFLRVERLPE